MAIAPAQDDRGLEPVSGQKATESDADMPALLMVVSYACGADRTRVSPGVEDQGTRPSPGKLGILRRFTVALNRSLRHPDRR